MGQFSDGFLTVVAATAMLYWLRSLLANTIQSLRYQHLMAYTCPRSSLPIPPLIHSVSVGIPSWTSRSCSAASSRQAALSSPSATSQPSPGAAPHTQPSSCRQ